MIETNAIYVIVAREFKKFIREKSRLISTLARPLLWLYLIGGGMSRLVPAGENVSYIQFIFPGILGMTILFSSIFSSISIIWDKEFGLNVGRSWVVTTARDWPGYMPGGFQAPVSGR